MVLNSLADLSYRENRFAHYYAPLSGNIERDVGQPKYVRHGNRAVSGLRPRTETVFGLSGFRSEFALRRRRRARQRVELRREGVGSRGAGDQRPKSSNPLVPSDPGYPIPYSSTGTTVLGYGAYVDLDWNNGTAITNPSGAPPCYFAGLYYGNGYKSYEPTSTTTSVSYYDTWSAGYEAWSAQFRDAGQFHPIVQRLPDPPPGTTTVADGGVDGPNERLTCPPYPVPLRGIQIKIRTYEFSSKQVREVTIQQSFVPD